MKPAKDKGVKVVSTIEGEDVAMGIDQEALTHIMGVLTDLYADPELAIIREYATNALDAHVEAGVSRAIEVATPTDLRPTLTVRDYGVGLDAEDIRAIYSRYGTSTKRHTNNAVGMLGLGCKSALAYTDQFTLVGCKDGTRTAVSVSRDERGAGTMTILESGPTEEPDGVTVAIPAKRRNQLAVKAATFFAHWPEGTVTLNGEAPKRLDGYQLTDDLLVAEDEHYGDSKHEVVMGNVAYPAPDLKVNLPAGKRLIARVPIGAVQFAPSREALQDTRATQNGLKAVERAFVAAATAAIERDVGGAASPGEAVAAMTATEDNLGITGGDIRWRGEIIPRELEAPSSVAGYRDYIHVVRDRKRYWGPENEHSSLRALPMRLAARAAWITGWDNGNWTAANRRKLIRYCEVHGFAGDRGDFILTREDKRPAGKWLDACPTVAWDDIRKWKDPDASQANVNAGSRAYAGTYPAYDTAGTHHWKLPADKIDQSKPIFYARYVRDTVWQELQEEYGPCTLVQATEPREAKFKRLFTAAESVAEARAKAGQRWVDKLTPKQQRALGMWSGDQDGARLLAALDPAKLDDPDMAEGATLAKVYLALADKWARHRHVAAKLPNLRPPELIHFPLYPRYNISRGKETEHTILYVNAVYAARKKEDE